MVKTLLLTSTSVSTVKRSKCTIVIKSAISDKHSNEIFILKFERWLNKYSVYSRFTKQFSVYKMFNDKMEDRLITEWSK